MILSFDVLDSHPWLPTGQPASTPQLALPAPVDADSSADSGALPPWRQKPEDLPPSSVEKVEAPLEKFIRVFKLDELAAKCLLKLQDDEAAFVIEP